MTDVRAKTKSGSDDQINNAAHVFVPRGNHKLEFGIDYQTPISGVNGVTDNGPLDDRFDDPRYYSGPTSEEYVEKGY